MQGLYNACENRSLKLIFCYNKRRVNFKSELYNVGRISGFIGKLTIILYLEDLDLSIRLLEMPSTQ